MQRPGCIGHLNLGLWFIRATLVEDKLLMYMARTQDALKHIAHEKYNQIPDLLTVLNRFNLSLVEK